LGSFTYRKARHGTDGFTSPLKEGVLRIFLPEKSTASAGSEPANWGTEGQHATSRPPKLQFKLLHYKIMRMVSFGLQHKIQNYGLQSVKKHYCLGFQICVVKLSFVQKSRELNQYITKLNNALSYE
jgi:hypothetical protein